MNRTEDAVIFLVTREPVVVEAIVRCLQNGRMDSLSVAIGVPEDPRFPNVSVIVVRRLHWNAEVRERFDMLRDNVEDAGFIL